MRDPAAVPRRACAEVYGVEFAEVVALDAGGPLTHQALDTGIVDVALLFSTDPAIGNGDLVELIDDRELQPAENVTPIVRRDAVDRFGTRLVDTARRGVGPAGHRRRCATSTRRSSAAGSIRSTATRWLDAEQLP